MQRGSYEVSDHKGTLLAGQGLFISNWTPSESSSGWLGLMQVFFHFWLLFSPWIQGPELLSIPGHKVRSGGAHEDAGGDFYAAKQVSGLQLFKKKSFHILPSPLNCPNTSEITTSLFAANGEICFTASTGRKQNTPFGRKNVFASLLQKGQYMSLSGSLMFQNGAQTPWFSHRCGVLRARKLLFLLLLKYSDRLSHWAWVCGVPHRIPHEVPMPRGSTNTLLYFCLGWIPTLIPAVGLCLVSPTQS